MQIEYFSAKAKELKKVIVDIKTAEQLSFVAVPSAYEHSFIEVSGSVSILRSWVNKVKNR
jgi:hypothetical protein